MSRDFIELYDDDGYRYIVKIPSRIVRTIG